MNDPKVISGHALTGEELLLEPVDIVIEKGVITSIEENPGAPDVWICPAFFNAHTHLGDTIAIDCATTGDLVALVTPPNGLKHRLLATASRRDLITGMRAGIKEMIAGGTAGCADFREGGEDGVSALRKATFGLPFHPIIFGREGGETIAEGLGISSTRDVPDVEQMVAGARKLGKMIAFHAGERDAEDIDDALAFDPDLLIHCTHATKQQLRKCAERKIPIVICSRSNWTLGVAASAEHPPVHLMKETGCTVFLGTDNAMFVPPDMFSEMAFVSTVYRLEPRAVIRAAVGGSALTGTPFFIKRGTRANLFVIDPSRTSLNFSRDPCTSIVKRVNGSMIRNNVFNL